MCAFSDRLALANEKGDDVRMAGGFRAAEDDGTCDGESVAG
jgi:hypothetical protein